ncbi:polynucleotide adenylyltransferase, partial [Halomonas beimenensis]
LPDQAPATRALCRAVRHEGPSGGRVMAWLDAVDAWRRPERVAPLISLISLEEADLAADLALAWRLAVQILPAGLVEEGYRGRELGEELARRRRAVIDEVLAE